MGRFTYTYMVVSQVCMTILTQNQNEAKTQ